MGLERIRIRNDFEYRRGTGSPECCYGDAIEAPYLHLHRFRIPSIKPDTGIVTRSEKTSLECSNALLDWCIEIARLMWRSADIRRHKTALRRRQNDTPHERRVVHRNHARNTIAKCVPKDYCSATGKLPNNKRDVGS